LLSYNILSAPVYDGEKYIGFLDIKDLVTFVLTLYDEGFFETGTNISDILRSAGDKLSIVELSKKNKFIPVDENDSLFKVVQILATDVPRVPVLGQNGKVINIISQSSIISIISRHCHSVIDNVTIESLIDMGTNPVVTVLRSTSFLDTLRLLEEKRISGVAIVTEEGRMIGVTTSKDLKLFVKKPSLSLLKGPIFQNLKLIRLDDIDERSLSVSVFERDTFKRTIEIMSATKVHRIFVMDNEKEFQPIRVISISDILKYLTN